MKETGKAKYQPPQVRITKVDLESGIAANVSIFDWERMCYRRKWRKRKRG